MYVLEGISVPKGYEPHAIARLVGIQSIESKLKRTNEPNSGSALLVICYREI